MAQLGTSSLLRLYLSRNEKTRVMNSHVALLALSQEIWYDIFTFLEPADWCHLQATSRHQYQRLDSWFRWMDSARIPLNQKSRAWTPKHRVCRYVLAKRYCQRLIHLHQKRPHTSSSSTHHDPYHKIRRHEKMNFLEREYFIQIARHSHDGDYCCTKSNDDASNSSSTTTILWSGFLAGGYESLQLDPIQHEITIASVETNGSDELSSPWKEWENLLDLAATKGLLAASNNDEWNSKWDRCVQTIRQHYSIVIVSLDYWLPSSMVDHHSAPPSAQQCPQVVNVVIPTYPPEELAPKLLIHRGEEDATRGTSTEYEAIINTLDVIRRARTMHPEPACVHLWLMPHEKRSSPRTTKQRNYHFAELRLDL